MKKAVFLFILLVFLSLTNIGVGKSDEGNKFCIANIIPESLHPSDISTITITIKNIGTSSAYHVATEVIMDEDSPIKILGRAKKDIKS